MLDQHWTLLLKRQMLTLFARVFLKIACVLHGSMLSYVHRIRNICTCLDRSSAHTLLQLQFSVCSNVSLWHRELRIALTVHLLEVFLQLLCYLSTFVLCWSANTRTKRHWVVKAPCSNQAARPGWGKHSIPRGGFLLYSAFLEERKVEDSSFSRHLFTPVVY